MSLLVEEKLSKVIVTDSNTKFAVKVHYLY